MSVVTDTIGASASPAESRSEMIAFLIMVAILIVAPFFVYPLFLMQALCFALFACAFNLLIGYVGLLSFGHAMFFGFAAYVSGYAAKYEAIYLPFILEFPYKHVAWIRIPIPTPELAIVVGVIVAALLGLVAGAIAIRRQGIYFA